MNQAELIEEGQRRYGTLNNKSSTNNEVGHIEKCKECGKEFETDTEVYSHLKSAHGITA